MIVRKFTNYFNNVYRKSHPDEPLASEQIKTNPLLKFTSVPSGRQVYARDFHDEIEAVAAQRMADTGINAAAAHQIVLKEMWDALSPGAKLDWESQAEDEAGDVEVYGLPHFMCPTLTRILGIRESSALTFTSPCVACVKVDS